MDNCDLQDMFLGFLYEMNFGDTDPTLESVDEWVKSAKIDKTVFWKQYELLINDDLIRFIADEAVVRLTPRGTLYTEKAGYVPLELVAKNRDARKKLMVTMSACLTNSGPRVMVSDLISKSRLDGGEVYGNLELLIDMGYANWEIPYERISISPKVCAKTSALGKAA